MFPIPTPDRLLPRPLRSQRRSGGSDSLAEGILALGAYPLIIAGVLAGALLAGSSAGALWRWLVYPAGFLGGVLGFAIAITLLQPTVLCGIIEAVAYSCMTFVLSGGRDRADPSPSLISAGIVAAVFLGVTFAAWRRNRTLRLGQS